MITVDSESIKYSLGRKVQQKMDNLDGSLELYVKRQELMFIERYFQSACEQILLLDQRIRELKVRCERARQQQLRPFQYNLQLRLTVMEDIRNVYYNYASQKCGRICQLQRYLYGQVLEIVYTSDDNNEHSDNES